MWYPFVWCPWVMALGGCPGGDVPPGDVPMADGQCSLKEDFFLSGAKYIMICKQLKGKW